MKASVLGLAFVSVFFLAGCTEQGEEQGEAHGRDTANGILNAIDSHPNSIRTDEEIQKVFYHNRSSLYKIYQRHLQKVPKLQGSISLQITINSNGTVSACSIESSNIQSEEFLAEIIEDVRKFDFGEKPNVPLKVISYPIQFLPETK